MEPLAAMEALMLAGETVGSAMHVGVLLILSAPQDAGPDHLDALYRDSLVGARQVDPRLRRYPHRGLDTAGVWVWREAADIDVRDHLRRLSLPSGSGLPELWKLVSGLHSERLPLDAPLWMSWLIDGLPEGRFALYIKVHHTVIDGVGGLRMIEDSLSTDPARRGMPPFYADKSAPDPNRRRGLRLPGPLAGVRAIADAAAAGLDLTRRVAAAELSTVVGSLTSDSVVAPLEAPKTRFNAKLSPRRAAAGISLPRDRIRAVQDTARVSGNDVVTAVIAGAVRAWLAERGELPARSLVAMCPVSVRSRDDDGAAQGGNHFGLGLCPLGTDIEDPGDRLVRIHRAMSRIKREVGVRGTDAMLAVMGPAIGSTVVMPLLPFGTVLPPSCNLAISNVPGPAEEMYYNGAHVDAIYPVSSAFDGMGLNATVCRYGGHVEIGYVTDAQIMDDVGELVPLTTAALTELEAALGISTP